MTLPIGLEQPTAVATPLPVRRQLEGDTVVRAQEDYQRLLSAYVALARDEHSHEVALAMVGADMERARATLQGLTGQLPFARKAAMLGRTGRRMVEQRS